MTYSPTKFEVATSNGLGGDTFTRNVTDGRTDVRTDVRRTDFDTKLIYPFFLKKKAGITIDNVNKAAISKNTRISILHANAHCVNSVYSVSIKIFHLDYKRQSNISLSV